MPSFGTCIGKRRSVGISSIGMQRFSLESEVHPSFPFVAKDG